MHLFLGHVAPRLVKLVILSLPQDDRIFADLAPHEKFKKLDLENFDLHIHHKIRSFGFSNVLTLKIQKMLDFYLKFHEKIDFYRFGAPL